MNRYLILVSAFIMQMCLGATYSWSVYVQPLRKLTGLLQGPAQLPFSLFYLAFPLTMILSGTLLARLGPRRCTVAGGIAFGGGWLLASLGGQHFAFTVVGIGLLAGVGVGFAYIVPIAICIQWFPRHRGLVTGVAVAGFGGGAALVSQIGGYLMSHGMSPFRVFGGFGVAFLFLVTLAGLTMKAPPRTGDPLRQRRPLKEVLGQKSFWVLYTAMFTGLAAGFAVNANLRDLSPNAGPWAGITAVSLFAAANALGRILWGLLFDRIRSVTAVQANLFCQCAILLSARWVLASEAGLLCFAFLTGLTYGGVLVVYASCSARLWGNESVGQVYGWLFSANVPAALAPLLVGFVYDRTGGFTSSLWVLGILLLVAALWVRRSGNLLDG